VDGFGSVPYWNAYVAVTEMHGSGTFFDARLSDPGPVPGRGALGLVEHARHARLVTSKLPALHAYQLSLRAPAPPAGSFDRRRQRAEGAVRGEGAVRELPRAAAVHRAGEQPPRARGDRRRCVPADRSPTHAYRTSPLAGLWTHQKGGFYHDGRFATIEDVIDHYDSFFDLGLTDRERTDLEEYLLSL
jgi:hypothetical protein